MIVASCSHEQSKKHGKDHNGNQRFRCKLCGLTWIDKSDRPLDDLRISLKDASTALGLLLEGMSIRAVARSIGVGRNAIGALILLAGENCQRFMDAKLQGIAVKDVQCDELWSFVGLKEKNRIKQGYAADCGDSWTFIAVERNTKLVLAHEVGLRDSQTCVAFLRKLNAATVGRFQLSTDGLSTYTLNVPFVLGSRVDFGQLIKTYAAAQETTRYSPAKIINSEKRPVFGDPDGERICTSHIERFNLTVRMSLRRFTRLTNAHSKSHKHHVAMQAIFFAHYNFCRKHETLKGRTPAMASGLACDVWTIREMLEVAAGI
jgi:IS1 family transposase/transposase-like protein